MDAVAEDLAKWLGWACFGVVALLFVRMLIRWCREGFRWK